MQLYNSLKWSIDHVHKKSNDFFPFSCELLAIKDFYQIYGNDLLKDAKKMHKPILRGHRISHEMI